MSKVQEHSTHVLHTRISQKNPKINITAVHAHQKILKSPSQNEINQFHGIFFCIYFP